MLQYVYQLSRIAQGRWHSKSVKTDAGTELGIIYFFDPLLSSSVKLERYRRYLDLQQMTRNHVTKYDVDDVFYVTRKDDHL